MTIKLLETKFHIPSAREGGVERTRLTGELDAGLRSGRKLTLVSAPAGYGKTTLIAAWLGSLPVKIRAGWLSLDEADNDPTRFLAYFLSTIQRQDSEIGASILSQPGSPVLSSLPALLDDLINDLAGRPMRLVVVLDDYHLITNTAIHEALEYLVEHLPPALHLVITTREDPPLPLARMRARGQMTEIRARELRFTPQEAGRFFNQSKHMNLTTEVVDLLEARTEGWAVGLQLAALTMQNLPDPQTFVENFNGSHRYVLDYLAEEVIRQQDEDLRRFLAQTSVLERMNASCCGALTGRKDCQDVLNHLEQANLFIIPLDDKRNWYRYHHLFADYLRSGLGKDEQAGLLAKAAGWYEDNDLIFEAVQYALASGNVDFTADIIERALRNQATWSGGHMSTLAGWVEKLPPSALRVRPFLSLHASRIMYLCGRNDEAEHLIDLAEESAVTLPSLSSEEKDKITAYACLYRGGITAMRGEVSKAVDLTGRALANLPEEDLLGKARAAYSLGLAYDLSGQTENSERAYLQTSELAEAAGVMFLAVNVHGAMAQSQITQGNLRRAKQICRQAMELTGEKDFGPLGLIWSILGNIALERDELDKAEKCLQTGMALSRQGGLQDDLISGLVTMARLRAAEGNFVAAVSEIEKARTIIHSYKIPRISLQAAALLARFQLAAGEKVSALRWAREYQTGRESGEVEYLCEFEDLTLVRVLLANHEWEAVPPVLDPVLTTSQDAGRNGICTEAMILKSLLLQTCGNIAGAVEWLGRAVCLAAPETNRRIFIEEEKSLAGLLPAVKSLAPKFVEYLLAKLPPSPTPILADPLSEQEVRVLKLIVAGKSNAEIAVELVISPGTAKWHVHHVLQKLEVGSRPQAIARARELGID